MPVVTSSLFRKPSWRSSKPLEKIWMSFPSKPWRCFITTQPGPAISCNPDEVRHGCLATGAGNPLIRSTRRLPFPSSPSGAPANAAHARRAKEDRRLRNASFRHCTASNSYSSVANEGGRFYALIGIHGDGCEYIPFDAQTHSRELRRRRSECYEVVLRRSTPLRA